MHIFHGHPGSRGRSSSMSPSSSSSLSTVNVRWIVECSMVDCFTIARDFYHLVLKLVSVITEEPYPAPTCFHIWSPRKLDFCRIRPGTLCPLWQRLCGLSGSRYSTLRCVSVTDKNIFDGSGLEFSFIQFLAENKHLIFKWPKMTNVGFSPFYNS